MTLFKLLETQIKIARYAYNPSNSEQGGFLNESPKPVHANVRAKRAKYGVYLFC